MRLLVAMILISNVACNVKAQEDSTEKTTVTLAAIYSTNVSYYGQVTSEQLPYVLANATVRFPMGLYISAGSYKLLNYGSGISEVDLGVGFDYDFDHSLSGGIAYTRSFYPSNSPLLQASLTNNLNTSLNYQWPWFKSSANVDFAFGQDKDIFLSLSNSKEITIGTLLNEEDLLLVEPAIEIIAGTKSYYQTYIVAKNRRGQEQGNGKAPAIPGNSGKNSTIITPSKAFSLLSYNLKLPVTYSRSSYMIEFSYQLSFLGHTVEPEIKRQQSFFGLAFYYQF